MQGLVCLLSAALWPPLTEKRRRLIPTWLVGEFGSPVGLFDTTLAGKRGSGSEWVVWLQPGEGESPGSLLVWFFSLSVLFDYSRLISVLVGNSFLGPSGESRLFLEVFFFFLLSWAVTVAGLAVIVGGFSSTQSRILEAKRKPNRPTNQFLRNLGSLGLSILFFPLSRIFLFVFSM